MRKFFNSLPDFVIPYLLFIIYYSFFLTPSPPGEGWGEASYSLTNGKNTSNLLPFPGSLCTEIVPWLASRTAFT
jgi:hypothetical protein